MIDHDLIEVARERGVTNVPRDRLGLRLSDGALLVWSGPPNDPERTIVREVPAPPPWGRK